MSDEHRTVTTDDVVFPPLNGSDLARYSGQTWIPYDDTIVMSQGVPTFDQTVSAKFAALETAVHKLTERVARNESWIHKLLNPNGDADGLHG